jgi:pyruvate/2-oxoglutarate dehydrogenase complex dihydrolipoamide acyltransferase (E2) component
MLRSIPLLLSKRITIPRLSPSHTKVRILRYEGNVANGMEVVAYDPIMVVECSPDLVTAGLRESPYETLQMMIDTQEEGVLRNMKVINETEWLNVGTEIGIIDDGDPIDGDWTWQAYLNK